MTTALPGGLVVCGTARPRLSSASQMTPTAMSVMSSRPPRPTTIRRSLGRFDLDTEFGKSAYRNTKGRRVSGVGIGCAIRNSTKTAAGNELTHRRHDSPQLCAFTPSPSIPCR